MTVSDLPQLGHQGIVHAVHEVILFGVARKVGQRQDGHTTDFLSAALESLCHGPAGNYQHGQSMTTYVSPRALDTPHV